MKFSVQICICCLSVFSPFSAFLDDDDDTYFSAAYLLPQGLTNMYLPFLQAVTEREEDTCYSLKHSRERE